MFGVGKLLTPYKFGALPYCPSTIGVGVATSSHLQWALNVDADHHPTQWTRLLPSTEGQPPKLASNCSPVPIVNNVLHPEPFLYSKTTALFRVVPWTFSLSKTTATTSALEPFRALTTWRV